MDAFTEWASKIGTFFKPATMQHGFIFFVWIKDLYLSFIIVLFHVYTRVWSDATLLVLLCLEKKISKWKEYREV